MAPSPRTSVRREQRRAQRARRAVRHFYPSPSDTDVAYHFDRAFRAARLRRLGFEHPPGLHALPPPASKLSAIDSTCTADIDLTLDTMVHRSECKFADAEPSHDAFTTMCISEWDVDDDRWSETSIAAAGLACDSVADVRARLVQAEDVASDCGEGVAAVGPKARLSTSGRISEFSYSRNLQTSGAAVGGEPSGTSDDGGFQEAAWEVPFARLRDEIAEMLDESTGTVDDLRAIVRSRDHVMDRLLSWATRAEERLSAGEDLARARSAADARGNELYEDSVLELACTRVLLEGCLADCERARKKVSAAESSIITFHDVVREMESSFIQAVSDMRRDLHGVDAHWARAFDRLGHDLDSDFAWIQTEFVQLCGDDAHSSFSDGSEFDVEVLNAKVVGLVGKTDAVGEDFGRFRVLANNEFERLRRAGLALSERLNGCGFTASHLSTLVEDAVSSRVSELVAAGLDSHWDSLNDLYEEFAEDATERLQETLDKVLRDAIVMSRKEPATVPSPPLTSAGRGRLAKAPQTQSGLSHPEIVVGLRVSIRRGVCWSSSHCSGARWPAWARRNGFCSV